MDTKLPVWEPTKAEVEQIVDEMRPLIRGFARRELRLLAHPETAGPEASAG